MFWMPVTGIMVRFITLCWLCCKIQMVKYKNSSSRWNHLASSVFCIQPFVFQNTVIRKFQKRGRENIFSPNFVSIFQKFIVFGVPAEISNNIVISKIVKNVEIWKNHNLAISSPIWPLDSPRMRKYHFASTVWNGYEMNKLL